MAPITPANSEEKASCERCASGADHCHEVLIVHVGALPECGDANCDAAVDRHSAAALCVELPEGCKCDSPGSKHSQPTTGHPHRAA